MASLDPVIDETVPGSPFRCLPDSTSKEAYVMQHGISVVCGENNPHVKQYQDPGGVFWPSNLLSQERDRPCVFTHKARLNIWDGRPESSFQGESETLALDLMEMVQSYPSESFRSRKRDAIPSIANLNGRRNMHATASVSAATF